jgi:hypothetical protein
MDDLALAERGQDMNSPSPLHTSKLKSALLATGTTLAFATPSVFAITGVEITGTNTDYGAYVFMAGTGGITKEQLCGGPSAGSGDAVASSVGALNQRLAPRLGSSTAASLQGLSRDEVMTNLGQVCTDPEDSTTAPFKLIYAACRMTMDSDSQLLDVVLPPDGTAGSLNVVDFANREVMHVSMQRVATPAESALAGSWGSAVDIDSGVDAGSIAGHDTRKFNFEYSGGMGGGEGSPMAGLAKVKNTGSVWIADDVDGIATVQDFYQNMSQEIDPAAAQQGFVAGLVNNLVSMLQNGVPLRMQQTVETSVMNMAPTTTRSHMEVYRTQEIDLPSDWCAKKFVPEGFTVRDLDQELSGAMSGGGEGEGASMADLQNMMNEAMKNMSPEELEMMKSMGAGAMQQMMGGQGTQPAPTDKNE